eukprot:c25092_g1_i1 orf=273-3575(-)
MHLVKHIGQRLNSCTLIKDAYTYFDSLLEWDVFVWNNFIALHARHDRSIQSVQLFQQMQQESVIPDDITLVHLLSAYTRHDLFCEGKRLHSCLFQEAIESNVVMGTALLTMYGRQGRVELAKSVFCQSKEQDVALWNAMMNIYAQNGQDDDVLQLFRQMQLTQLVPDKVTYACVLSACARLPELEKGRLIHTCIICMEMERVSMVATTLVNMYGKCSSLDDAQSLFDKLAEREVVMWNTLIAAFVKHGNVKQALFFFCQMHQEGVVPVKATFVSILGVFSSKVALAEGKRMHAHIASCGFLCDKVVTTALFNMYGGCGSMEDAENLFDGMVERTKISWNAMLSEHVQNRCGEKAFQIFDRMLWEGQVPDKVTYLNMLFACTLEETRIGGEIMHLQIAHCGCESEVAVATSLVSMYGKFGNLESARRLFNKMHERNILSWNGVLKVCAQYGLGKEVFQLLDQLKQEGMMPNDVTLISSLSVCANKTDIVRGKQLHVCIGHEKQKSELVLSNALIKMYAKCDSLQDALIISEKIVQKDIFSWNSLLEACAQKGDQMMAFQLLDQMRHEGVLPNTVTFIGILESCNASSNLSRCRDLHASIVQGEFKEDVTIASALVKTYGFCGNIMLARTVFNTVSNRDTILWNTMMSVYARQGHCTSILQMLDQMHQEGQLPTSITYVSLFSACASSEFVSEGMRLHSCISHSKLELDISLMNSLIFMYGKCGRHEVSERLFFDMPKRDRVAWSGMIAIYAELEYSKKALQLFYQMVCQEEILPDKITLVSTLSACTCSALLAEGKEIHTHITALGFDAGTEVANSLANMYGKCGALEDAWALFENLSKKDTCSWNTMFASLLHHGHDVSAIHLFKQMQQEEVYPSEITYASMLSACGNLASLINGRHVHVSIVCNAVESVPTIGNSIVSMYGKCGSLDDALRQFDRLSARDIVSWNTMIAAYAQHGCGEEAFKLLNLMRSSRSPPDKVSFLTTVSACSHTGLVDTVCDLWISMCQDLNIKPGPEHYVCLVDVFSRAGRLVDAEKLITNMPYQPCYASWTALLSACRDHAYVAQGLQVAGYLLEIDPHEFSTHVMLSNIHVAASRMTLLGS